MGKNRLAERQQTRLDRIITIIRFSKHSPEFLHRHHSPQRRISSYCDIVALFHHAVATEREHKQQKHGAH